MADLYILIKYGAICTYIIEYKTAGVTWWPPCYPYIADRPEFGENILEIVAIGVFQQAAHVDLAVDVPVAVRHSYGLVLKNDY
jgi:hypothetical protein